MTHNLCQVELCYENLLGEQVIEQVTVSQEAARSALIVIDDEFFLAEQHSRETGLMRFREVKPFICEFDSAG